MVPGIFLFVRGALSAPFDAENFLRGADGLSTLGFLRRQEFCVSTTEVRVS